MFDEFYNLWRSEDGSETLHKEKYKLKKPRAKKKQVGREDI